MYKRILVPIDGSIASQRGLREALRVARGGRAQLRLFHALDAFPLVVRMQGSKNPGREYHAMQASARRLLARGIGRARRAGLRASGRLVENFSQRVADLIVREARNWRADLIVLGTHGRRGLTRIVLGSDAELVVRHAPVPVLLVRAGR
jgi:nucleotide-binding universal stress UspA family protein